MRIVFPTDGIAPLFQGHEDDYPTENFQVDLGFYFLVQNYSMIFLLNLCDNFLNIRNMINKYYKLTL